VHGVVASELFILVPPYFLPEIIKRFFFGVALTILVLEKIRTIFYNIK